VTTGRPTYAQLRTREPAGSSWSVWPQTPELGCLNNLSPALVAAAAAGVTKGSTFVLGLDLDAIEPPLFGRPAAQHTLTREYDGPYHDDILDGFNTQSGSQWDGFRHARNPVHGWYGGLREEQHGVKHWAQRGIAGRGLLVDIGRWKQTTDPTYRPDESADITVADLDAALSAQGATIEAGDILCIRTGWLSWYRSLDAAGRADVSSSVHCAGLAPGHETLAWLWDHQLSAVVSDNPTVEAWPAGSTCNEQLRREVEADLTRVAEISLHRSALPLLGLPLAQDCAADGRWSFFLTAAPIGLPGGAASPANALAFK
jgi:kynurenine formamidase